MIDRTILIASCFVGAAVSGPALARDAAVAAQTVAIPGDRAAPPVAAPTEVIGIAVMDGRDVVWSGSLRIGGQYGNANFSQSKSEYGPPCEAGSVSDGGNSMRSESLSFSIGRHNWQQAPDRFNIHINWTKPVAPCLGEGSDSFGFNRVVLVPRGQSVTIEGSGAMSVRLTRAR
jgi:hypothetical protein